MNNQKILAIIPARGGSKGVPLKNIQLIGGKPLIYWSIKALVDSGVIDRVVVSTDHESIATHAKDFGAEVVWRPIELSGDTASSESAMRHVVDYMEEKGYFPDYVSLVQCTSPFLDTEIVRTCVGKVCDLNNNYDSCITAFKPDGYEFKWRSEDGSIFVPDHDVEHRPRRQDLDLPYHENGAFYITRTDFFKKTNNRFGGKDARVGAVTMSELDSLQIDSPEHVVIADLLMKLRSSK